MAYYNNPDIDWSAISESGGGSTGRLEPGGYVVRITHAEWGDGCLEVVWDVAEGDRAGFFGGADEWRHRQRVWYKGRAMGMFKHFLATVERSNPGGGFAADKFDNRAEALEGLLVGALVQTHYYWSTKYNESKDELEVAVWKDADDIRSGDFTLPAPRDTRIEAQKAAAEAQKAAAAAVKAQTAEEAAAEAQKAAEAAAEAQKAAEVAAEAQKAAEAAAAILKTTEVQREAQKAAEVAAEAQKAAEAAAEAQKAAEAAAEAQKAAEAAAEAQKAAEATADAVAADPDDIPF